MAAARIHARSVAHRRVVEQARRAVDQALVGASTACVMVSAGKDSTILAHVVTALMGRHDVTLVSEKDDLDYPGEEEYLRLLAAEWGATLRVVRPRVSPAEWIRSRGATRAHRAADDIHSRAAGLSKACFYRVVEAVNAEYDVVMLGLRAQESTVRRIVRHRRGLVYTLASGQRRANPLFDWRGLDLYAYAESHSIPLLPLYRCIAFMHERRPWDVRKAWWLPGGHSTRNGGVAWLKHYFPTLYDQLCEWIPGAPAYR